MIQILTAYTEVDAGTKLTVAYNKITAANLLRNEDAYIYKDFGANYFNELDIDFEFFVNSASADNGIAQTGLTVSTVNDGSAWSTSDVCARYVEITGVARVILTRGPTTAQDASTDLSLNTVYYCTLSRPANSDTIILKIYSDATRVTLVDTLSVSGFGTSTKYRYLFGMCSYNSATTQRWDGYVQNIVNKLDSRFFLLW